VETDVQAIGSGAGRGRDALIPLTLLSFRALYPTASTASGMTDTSACDTTPVDSQPLNQSPGRSDHHHAGRPNRGGCQRTARADAVESRSLGWPSSVAGWSPGAALEAGEQLLADTEAVDQEPAGDGQQLDDLLVADRVDDVGAVAT
jgi:hypothetical protein